MTQRAAAQFDMRQTDAEFEWVFPASTATGHLKKSTLKKQQHKRALAAAKVEPFTHGYLAGHSDFSTTHRYVHPQADIIKADMEKARVAGDQKAKRPEAPSPRL